LRGVDKPTGEDIKRMTLGRSLLVALTLVTLPTAGEAQFPLPLPIPGNRGTPEDQAACRPDARRLCREYVGNDSAVLACFQQNREKLSPPCAAVLRRYGQ
jgi:hypothetical protein